MTTHARPRPTGGLTRYAALLALLALTALLTSCLPAPAPGSSDSPSGYVDAVTGGVGVVRVQGWASDWNTTAPIRVAFLRNGAWVSGFFTADRPRSDVDAAFGRGAAFGFDETIPAPPGPVTICVSAINVGRGDNTFLGCRSSVVTAAPVAPSGTTTTTTTVPAPEPAWRTVVNNGDVVPGSTEVFNSYNQPSVNTSGLVTFRARTKGEGARGVYARLATTPSSPLQTIAEVNGLVPAPNNLDADFNEFPSIPRIDRSGSTIATRGQSVPVWTYTPEGGEETRVGTSGVYATVGGTLTSAATLLGAVPGFERFSVPGAAPGTRFDQFPGAPAVDGTTIVFKGNFTEGDTGRTGIFYRDASGTGPTQVIASSATLIPGQPEVGGEPGTVTFGSTAPPSAAGDRVVFTGLDNEDAPTLGGVYLAPIGPTPTLQPLVGIGDRVPGMTPSDVFTSIGEGLSFDGRFVTFWGAWGETKDVTLTCPADGNKDLLAYCNSTYPDGFVAKVPVHQGIFVHDTVTHTTSAVATSDTDDPTAAFANFQYWTFSGKPPSGTGGTDSSQELPRWRSSAFAAVSGNGAVPRVAFKATTPLGVSGIHLATGTTPGSIVTVVDTTRSGVTVDPEAPADTFVTSVGLERDGFRGRYLALNVAMANADASLTWGGIYLVAVDRLPTSAGVGAAPATSSDQAQPHTRQATP